MNKSQKVPSFFFQKTSHIKTNIDLHERSLNFAVLININIFSSHSTFLRNIEKISNKPNSYFVPYSLHSLH